VWESSDVTGLVSLLREDATLTLPPMGLWFTGAANIIGFYGAAFFGPGVEAGRYRVVPVEAAGHVALAISTKKTPSGPWEPTALQLLEAEGDQLVHLVAWVDPVLTARFLNA